MTNLCASLPLLVVFTSSATVSCTSGVTENDPAFDGKGDSANVENDRGHLETFDVDGATIDGVELPARTLYIWFPNAPITHTLYVHDGQNLWEGGWRIHDNVPEGMVIVGIENAGGRRFDEYTHVQDENGGGNAAAYAAYVQNVVRPRVRGILLGGDEHTVGVMGSSLGGLVSLFLVDAFPDDYAFVASLSGTQYWGSLGANFHNQTIVERYASQGHRKTKIYLDSGGGITDDSGNFVSHDSGDCRDLDDDGLTDDTRDADNFCANHQLRIVLENRGYQHGVDLFHWYQPEAGHNEAAWAKRVSGEAESGGSPIVGGGPVQIFGRL